MKTLIIINALWILTGLCTAGAYYAPTGTSIEFFFGISATIILCGAIVYFLEQA